MAKLQKVILVIDAQEGFRNANTEGALSSILKAIRTSESPVLFTRFINDNHSNFKHLLEWSKMRSHVETEMLHEISAFVTPPLLFEKHGYSAFTSQKFCEYLRDIKAQSIDICGFDTDACVLATALDAFDAGYQPKILANACASSGGMHLHNSAIEILQRNLGKDAIVRERIV